MPGRFLLLLFNSALIKGLLFVDLPEHKRRKDYGEQAYKCFGGRESYPYAVYSKKMRQQKCHGNNYQKTSH